jgi:L-galactose dehydrogenase
MRLIMPLPTRELGRTGLTVPVLGFGAATLGGSYGPMALDEAQRAVHAALAAGMNLFDTSPYYGGGESERVLGRCLRGIPRHRFLLATKVGRYGDQDFDFSAARVVASVDESLARLGTDHLDLVHCHDIEFWPLQRIIDEALPALKSLKQAGKIRAIGITGYPLRIFHQVLAQTPVDAVLSYCHHTLLDNTLATIVPSLDEQGVGVFNASPLAMGLLSTKGPPPWHPAPAGMKAACRAAVDLCAKHGADLGQLALHFALTLPGVSSTFVGIGSLAQLERNLAVLDQEVAPELLAAVQDLLSPWHNHTWSSGLPENQ